VLASMAFLGTLYVVSLYYQDGRHLSALQSGLSTFPEALGVMAGAQLASRWIYPRLGPRRHMTAGVVATAASIAAMALLDEHTSLWWARLVMLVLGLSMAQVFVPSQAAAFATISPADTGRASTMFNAFRQLGGAIGVAGLTSVLVAVGSGSAGGSGGAAGDLTAYRVAFLVAAGIALLGVACSLLVNDGDAAATRPGRRTSARAASDRAHAEQSQPVLVAQDSGDPAARSAMPA
ncbi:MAG: MFS transporter, partial [Actinobacteria bacterium]|nr:MFS transporter [Actinomycetota bacterium]